MSTIAGVRGAYRPSLNFAEATQRKILRRYPLPGFIKTLMLVGTDCSYTQYLRFGQVKLVVFGVIRVTSRGRIAHVSKLVSSLWMQRLSSFIGTAELSTALPWKSPGQARGSGRGQPSSCQDKLNSRRTRRASEA